MSFGESKKSYGAKSCEYGGCKMMVIFFVAKNSHTGRVECIVLVENPILGFNVQVVLVTFAVDAEGCHSGNVGLHFVFVEKLYNARDRECWKKSERPLYILVNCSACRVCWEWLSCLSQKTVAWCLCCASPQIIACFL